MNHGLGSQIGIIASVIIVRGDPPEDVVACAEEDLDELVGGGGEVAAGPILDVGWSVKALSLLGRSGKGRGEEWNAMLFVDVKC